MKNITIAILAALVIVFAFLFFTHKNAPVANTPWPETVPAHTQTATGCKSTDPASIVVSNPVAGASFVTGQHVVIKWKSCNVGTVSLGLVMGGKSFGEISTENPISASTGSYEWIATNPGQQFTQANTNSYQIVVQSQAGDVTAKGSTFTVTTPQSTTKTYSRNGFTIQYPADVVVHEEQAEGGPFRVVHFGADGSISYVQNADFFEQYSMIPVDYTLVGTKVINGHTFKEYKVYGESAHKFWLRTGNTGYEIHLGDNSRIDINSFDLI